MLAFLSAVVRGLARNIQVYNPTPHSLDVRWDPAPGPVQQYRIVHSPEAGTRPPESVSNLVILELRQRISDSAAPHAVAAGPEE